MKKLLQHTCMAAFLAALALPATGTIISFDLTDEFSGGATPAGTFTATFDDTACGLNCVQLELEATGALGSGEFITEWDFNFDPAKDVTALVFALDASSTGPAATNINTGQNLFKADGGRHFDIQFLFSSNNRDGGLLRFNVNETVVYNITGIVGLTADDFDFLATHISGNGGGANSAAHVQGIATSPGSGWITNEPGGPRLIPEPTVLWLLATGILALVFVPRRRIGRG